MQCSHSAVHRSEYDDRQFELDALGRSKTVETGESICNRLREMETSNRPSCGVEDGLETVKLSLLAALLFRTSVRSVFIKRTSSSAITEKPRCSVGQFWVAITPYSADRPISIKSNQIEIID